MSRLHLSIFFSGAERYGSLVIFLFSAAVLARLLNPEEFGIYTTIYALTVVAGALAQEFGGANYLIQKVELSERDVRTAFTVSMCIALVLAALLFGLRDVIASFYAQPGLKMGLAISSFNLLLFPFSLTSSALLRRELTFGAVARCTLVSNFVTAIVAILGAAFGYSFMGPVVGAVVGHLVLVGLLITDRGNVSIFRPHWHGWHEVLRFGAYSGATASVNILYQMAPQLILGRVIDFAAVGLYGRAMTVTQTFDKAVIGALSPVVMPAILAQTRSGVDLKRIFLQAVELIAAVQWPSLIFVALMAEPVVWMVLGPNWGETVPLVRMLCLASLFMFAACLTYPVLVALGKVSDTLTISLITLLPSLLVVFVASFYGVWAVAASALLTFPFQLSVVLVYMCRYLDISLVDLVRSTVKSAIVALFSTAGAVAVVAMNDFSLSLPLTSFFFGCTAGLVGWYLGLMVTNHPLVIQMQAAWRGIRMITKGTSVFRRHSVGHDAKTA